MTTHFVIKRLRNSAKYSMVQIAVNNKQYGLEPPTNKRVVRDHAKNYLYIICAKFHILNHESFPDIIKKGICDDQKFMVTTSRHNRDYKLIVHAFVNENVSKTAA